MSIDLGNPRIKRRLSRGEYDIDPSLVADAIYLRWVAKANSVRLSRVFEAAHVDDRAGAVAELSPASLDDVP